MPITILPASIEPEYNFSSAGILCFELRFPTSDAVLDNMPFLVLRTYFANAMQFSL